MTIPQLIEHKAYCVWRTASENVFEELLFKFGKTLCGLFLKFCKTFHSVNIRKHLHLIYWKLKIFFLIQKQLFFGFWKNFSDQMDSLALLDQTCKDFVLLWDIPIAAALSFSGLRGVYLSRRKSFAVEACTEFSALGSCHLEKILPMWLSKEDTGSRRWKRFT